MDEKSAKLINYNCTIFINNFYLDPLKQYSMYNALNTIGYFNPGPDNYSFEFRQ